jgi:glycosyltransferase involved in cell wall biosynthesis
MSNTTDMAKRALIFSFVYYPRFIGGAEIAIKEITDRIDESEIEFDLVALGFSSDLPKVEKIGNVTVHRIGFTGKQTAGADSLPFHLHLNKYLYPFIAAWKGAMLHKERNYSFIWAMMANYSGFGALFFKMLHKDVPFLLTLQEGDPIDYIKKRVGPLMPLFRKIFKKADAIQTISHYLADFARDMGAICPVEVVPNGVGVAHFSKPIEEAELHAVKQALGKKDGDIFLITTSRLVVKNAVGDIVKSLEYLPKNVKLLILGTGYQESELKRLAKALGVSERVNFLGYVAHADMPKYLKVSDVFIRPSLSEGFGNSFIEAMAAKIPVIATLVGGIVDFLKHKETGLFCEVENPEDIARKVEVFMKDRNLRDEIVDRAFRMVEREYDWDLVARKMREKIFDRL